MVVCLLWFFFLMRRRPPRSTQSRSSAASDVYKRQDQDPRHRGRGERRSGLRPGGSAAPYRRQHRRAADGGCDHDRDVRRPATERAGRLLSLIHISEPTRPY